MKQLLVKSNYSCRVESVRIKVDVPKSNITIIWTPTFEWYGVGLNLRTDMEETHAQNKLKYVLKT